MHLLTSVLDSSELGARLVRALAIAAAFWLCSHVAARLVRWVARRRGAGAEPGSAVDPALGPLRALVVVLGLYYATTELALAGRLERFFEASLYLAAVGVALVAASRIALAALPSLTHRLG